MPHESLSLQPRKLEGKDYLGQQFKILLEKKAKLYDKELVKPIGAIAGEDFAKANRNIAVLKTALRDFVKIPNFTKEEETKIIKDIELLEKNDPLAERMNHYGTNETKGKNYYADMHNNAFTEYKSRIMKLLFDLKNVLPENMYQGLLSQNGMFAGLLNWAENN